ncbi:hypothetical protein [Streptomyces decoyicus]|uniref:hypothetical protein n=1 Tax=Streptomyces decoyicus TaxID=249567 RepID=UPI00382CBC16
MSCPRLPRNAASPRQKAPALITSKAPHPYWQITVSYDKRGHAIVHVVSTLRL